MIINFNNPETQLSVLEAGVRRLIDEDEGTQQLLSMLADDRNQPPRTRNSKRRPPTNETNDDNPSPSKKAKSMTSSSENESSSMVDLDDTFTIGLYDAVGDTHHEIKTRRGLLSDRSSYFADFFKDNNEEIEVNYDDLNVTAFMRAWEFVEDPRREMSIQDACSLFDVFTSFGFHQCLQKCDKVFFYFVRDINEKWRVSKRKMEGLGLAYGPEKQEVHAAVDRLIWMAGTCHKAGLKSTILIICLLAKLLCHPDKGVLFSQLQIKRIAPLMRIYPVLIEPFGLSVDLIENDLFAAMLQSKLGEKEILEALVRKYNDEEL
jgi:hypothetical protein